MKILDIKYALLLLFTQLLLSYTSLSFAAEVIPPKVIGQVLWVKGSVTGQLPHAEVRTLKRHSPVYEHDILTAGPASDAKISFKNNNILSLHENSTIKIDQYWSPEKKEADGFIKGIMISIRDGFRAITSRVADNEPGGYKADPDRVTK